jgi:hypothetical protein
MKVDSSSHFVSIDCINKDRHMIYDACWIPTSDHSPRSKVFPRGDNNLLDTSYSMYSVHLEPRGTTQFGGCGSRRESDSLPCMIPLHLGPNDWVS